MEENTVSTAGATHVAVSFDLPTQLHDHAMRVCSMRGVTMNEIIADLLARFLPRYLPDERTTGS